MESKVMWSYPSRGIWRKYTMKCNLEMSSLKRGGYLKIMLNHFEDEEDYEKCIKILELTDIIKKRY